MEAKLLVVRGKSNRREVALHLPCVIGRSREADLTVAHPMGSRRHCDLFETDGQIAVRDLKSLNGTLVNGRKVQEATLPVGAELTVGPLTFRVQYQAESTETADEDTPDFIFSPDSTGPRSSDTVPAKAEPAAGDEDAEMTAWFDSDDAVQVGGSDAGQTGEIPDTEPPDFELNLPQTKKPKASAPADEDDVDFDLNLPDSGPAGAADDATVDFTDADDTPGKKGKK